MRQRFFFEAGDPDNVVFGGIYFADRNFGLRGSEGVMVFNSLSGTVKFAHQFAVPYVSDNGTNMRMITGARPPMPELYRQMYDSRKVRVDFADGGFRLISTVNDARGGVVGLIRRSRSCRRDRRASRPGVLQRSPCGATCRARGGS